MTCGTYPDEESAMLAGEFLQAIKCAFESSGLLTGSMVLFLVFAGIEIALYIHSDGVAVPGVVAILFAGVMVAFVPGAALQFGLAVLAIVVGLAGVIILRRVR